MALPSPPPWSRASAAEERIRALNRLLRTRSAVDEAIVREQTREGLFQAVCEKALRAGEFHSVWIGRAEPDGAISLIAHAGHELDYLKDGAPRWDKGPLAGGPGGRSIRERRTIAVADTEVDEHFTPWREPALRAGVRSLASVPLVVRGEPYGVIAFLAAERNVFEGEVLDLVATLGGDISYAIENIDERSERRRLEEQLRQSQKMEAVGRLAGGIAHDFNNLLTIILGNCSEALEALSQDHPGRQHVAEIEDAANRAASLTRQLLAFSRRQILRPEVVNLNDVVKRIIMLLRRVIGEDVSLSTVFAADPADVVADPGQLEQILLNLCINSRDAMPHGGTVSIETHRMNVGPSGHERDRTMRPGAYVSLVVRDTGVGMSDEVKAQAFEPFFTTKELGKGTGLGLSTVYGIVRQSGGGIFFDSTFGGGTSFTVAFPASVDTAPPRVDEVRKPRASGGAETILLAEDQPGVRALARRALMSAGYRVMEAASGDEALAIAEAHEGTIAMVITDVVMPGMSGPELVQRLRARMPAVRVLYISGYAESAALDSIGADRHASFLQKPFTVAGVRARVRELLDG